MASVDSVERNRSTEEIRRVKQEAAKKEAQANERHKKQIEQLQRAYESDLDKVNSSYSESIQSNEQKTKEVLSQKDQRHLREMDEIKKLQTQKLKEISEQKADELDKVSTEHREDMSNMKKEQRIQIDSHARNYEEGLKKKEAEFNQVVDDVKQGQGQALHDMNRRMNKKNEEDKTSLRHAFEGEIDRNNRDIDNLKRQNQKDVELLNRRNDKVARDKDRAHMDDVTNQRAQFDALMSSEREMYKKNLTDTNGNYHKVLEAAKQRYDDSQKNLEETADRRFDTEMGSLKSQLRAEKANNSVKDIERKRIFQVEGAHLKQQAAEEVQAAEQHRESALKDAQERNSRLIAQVKGEGEALNYQQGKELRSKIDEIRGNELGALREQSRAMQAEKERNRSQNLLRDHQVVNGHKKELAAVENFYKDKLEQQDHLHEIDQKDRNNLALKERIAVVERLEKQLRDSEAVHSERMNSTVSAYEQQIGLMREDQKKESRRALELNQLRQKELEKGFKTELETERARNATLLAQTKEKYEKEIDQIKKRHELEKMELAKRGV